MAKGSVGGANPEFILREFQGMNTLDAREAINDNEFWWCENAIPLGSGTLYPVKGPTIVATLAAETGSPSYTTNFNANGTDFCFAVWAGSGHGWIVNLSSFSATNILNGLTSGQTSATQWSNQGLLILDPTGYWDWNITTANTLTPQNNGAAIATLVSANTIAGGTQMEQAVSGTGTGATFQAQYEVTTVTLTAGGTGYAVGDTINLTDGSPVTPAQIVVASISGGGATGPITGITLSTGGDYPGPGTATLTATGPTGTVSTTTGAGSGATFSTRIIATSLTILTRGTGYTGTTVVTDQYKVLGVFTTLDKFNVTSSGVIGGTSISTYAGHVWIASGRTVYFTDTDSYFSFGGVGGSFFIPDSYLHDNITALYAANNYLYIFGDTSIDALSNVTVSIVGGVALLSFSRINVTASVGTSVPTSIFAYYRAIVFYHSSGFYLLAGATPERISDKISGLIQNIAPASSGTDIPLVYGAQVLVRNELCAAFLFNLNDVFTQGGAARTILALFFRGKWWVGSPGPTAAEYYSSQAMVSIPIAGVQTLFFWALNSLYQAFSPSAGIANWVLKTKLWDGGAPVHEKQSINAAIGGQWAGLSSTGVTVNVDTELSTETGVQSPLAGTPSGYQLVVTAANEGGSQYLGLTVTGSTDMTQIDMLALRGKTDAHDFLA
jgi:hypothetical protein